VKTHTADARAAGESEERLYLLAAWREAPIYSARERAALAWTEALTELREGHVPDPLYDEARREFSEAELVNLTVTVGMINGWNRLAIAFRAMPEIEDSGRAAEPAVRRARG
jgi:alkylhydroperoxidase family enzyme